MHKLATIQTLWLPPIWLFLLLWCSLSDLSSRLEFISSTLPPWRKSRPASTLVRFSQHNVTRISNSCFTVHPHISMARSNASDFFSCWNAFPVTKVSVSNPILWNTYWKKGLFHFHSLPSRKELFIKLDRFQDNDEDTFASKWGHHAFK